MRLLLGVILLAAAFLGGYYCGRQPNSPDVFGFVAQAREWVSGGGQKVAQAPNPRDEPKPGAKPVAKPVAEPAARPQPATHVGEWDLSFRPPG